MSSSSDFSSDEEDDAQFSGVSYEASTVPHAVQVEVVEEQEEPEQVNAQELLDSLQSNETVPETLVQALEPVLSSDPAPYAYNYDAYTAALYYLSSLWPHDAPAATHRSLRLTRAELYRRFHRAFPLTEQMYSEFIGDVDSIPLKMRLYDQAMYDYWSVPLALEGLQLAADNSDMLSGGNPRMALLAQMEALLRTVGCHYTQGHDVWKRGRELTAQLYDEEDDSSDRDVRKEAALRDLYARQMRLPLQQNDLVMSEFRAWNQYNTVVPEAVSREQALRDAEEIQQRVFGGAVYKKLNQFEERVVAATNASPPADGSEPESLEKVWPQYINFVQHRVAPRFRTKTDSTNYLVCLMERAVASVCLSSSLWRKYVLFVSEETPDKLLSVTRRATRNVSFDSSFWIDYLLEIERQGSSLDEVTADFESNVLSRSNPPLMDAAHCSRVLTTYCGVVRRLAQDDSASVDDAVARCRSLLDVAYPVDKAPLAAVLAFQAQFYAFQVPSNRTKRHVWLSIWQEILQTRGEQAEAWCSFYEEYRFTHFDSEYLVQELRDLVFIPAMDRVRDYPLLVLEKWLQLELAKGDRAAYTSVKLKYDKTAIQMQQQQEQQNRAVASSTDTVAKHADKSTTKKRKPDDDAVQTNTKRQKPAVASSSDHSQKSERFTNEHTLFVCNIPKDVAQDELQALFGHISGLKDVRLVVKERANHIKSRGMAYVQMSDENGVNEGLKLDGTQLHGQAIKVERSIPPQASRVTAKAKGKQQNFKPGKIVTTLYVGGLMPPERDPITEDELKQALGGAVGESAVKRVLILTNKRGRPKEYALVEMTSTEAVDIAIKKIDEVKAKLGDQVTLQLSRLTIEQVVKHREEQKQMVQQAKAVKQQQNQEKKPKKMTSLQPKAALHAKPNTRLEAPKKVLSGASLMPRALRKKAQADAPTEANKAEQSSTGAPKTNDDFRKLFLG